MNMMKILNLRVTGYWNRVPREVVEYLPLEIIKTYPEAFLSNPL